MYLFNCWQSLKNQITDAEKVFIFSDYDGTLTNIRKRPDLATATVTLKEILRKLTDNPHYKFAIVTGRSLHNIIDILRLPKIYYIGNHGLEIKGPNINFIHQDAVKIIPNLNSIQKTIRSEIGHLKGLIIENKRLTLSIHYRLVQKDKAAPIGKLVRQISTKYPDIKITKGKKVYEIRPSVDWNKGKACAWVLKTIAKSALPVYLGDDKTDEDAFITLKNGITVLVSKRKKYSNAKFYLKDATEVQKLLNDLLKL